MTRNNGDLQVWWIPQVPGTPFEVDVTSVAEGVKILQVLAEYDKFQLEHNIKPDYSNVGGLRRWCEADGDWEDWYDEETGIENPEEFLAIPPKKPKVRQPKPLTPEQEKRNKVLEAIKDLSRQYGRVYFDAKQISAACDVPVAELWDWDNDKGILLDLNDSGYLILERGRNVEACLDADTLC